MAVGLKQHNHINNKQLIIAYVTTAKKTKYLVKQQKLNKSKKV